MKLSELKTGESGVIAKVYGHGGFRKRIIEMGFIKGENVEVILNAPLRDPVKYKIMDYEVSLRRAEAELIEVVNEDEAKNWDAKHPDQKGIEADTNERIRQIANIKGKELNVVFVGNPNSGKTSIFNIASGAHERVGNYSGVTVDAKEGRLEFEDYTFNIVDLPGTYSLSAYSPEELYVRKYIIENKPDVIINVVDSSNLERNLYLTAQLIDMDVPMVVALNMFDELKKSGNKLNIEQLGALLGMPIIPTVGRTGEGVRNLFKIIIDIETGKQKSYRHIHVNHGKLIEQNIEKLEELIRQNPEPHFNYSGRFLAIKLLENDKQIENITKELANWKEILEERGKCQKIINKESGYDCESVMTDAKYGFVQGALKECFVKAKTKHRRLLTKRIDAIVTNKIWGYPIFFLLMYLMFYCTFNIGQYPMDWIDSLVAFIGDTISANMADGPLKDLIVDGIVGGVGGVIVFLPNIMILYAFISWMEDSGYMARAAFIMDSIMHKMGLHGKSFIPMIMGFGCNIPAIMATRTIEDRKSRLITMLIVPLMSCSARLPVYIIIIGAFFPNNSALILFGLYLTGIIMSILMAKLFSRFIVKGESSPFVMELPPYRLPNAKSVVRHTWEKGYQYLKKMGTTILVASIIIWALSYYPRPESHDTTTENPIENSYIGRIGKFIEPAIRPCGFEWKEGVSIITGVGAKEIVASTMGVLYSQNGDSDSEEDEDAENMRLSRIIAQSGMTSLAAISFLVFILLYMPCIPACISIKNESGKWKWALFTIVYTTLLAWTCSTIIYQIGSIFTS